MGWCSGTDVFDPMVEAITSEVKDTDLQYKLILALIDALEWHDWDCQQDSQYYDLPVVQKAMHKIHPNWFEDEENRNV